MPNTDNEAIIPLDIKSQELYVNGILQKKLHGIAKPIDLDTQTFIIENIVKIFRRLTVGVIEKEPEQKKKYHPISLSQFAEILLSAHFSEDPTRKIDLSVEKIDLMKIRPRIKGVLDAILKEQKKLPHTRTGRLKLNSSFDTKTGWEDVDEGNWRGR